MKPNTQAPHAEPDAPKGMSLKTRRILRAAVVVIIAAACLAYLPDFIQGVIDGWKAWSR